MRNESIFICQLTQEEQRRIEADARKALEQRGIRGAELDDVVSNIMHDRLWFCAEIMDIWQYLHPGEDDPAAEWHLGPSSCIQCVTFDRYGEEEDTECMPGYKASVEIRQYIKSPWLEPISDERGVYGFKHRDGSRWEYWDCDEQTYFELYGSY